MLAWYYFREPGDNDVKTILAKVLDTSRSGVTQKMQAIMLNRTEMGSLVVMHKGWWMLQVGEKGMDVSQIWANAHEVFACHFLKCCQVHIAPNTDVSLSIWLISPSWNIPWATNWWLTITVTTSFPCQSGWNRDNSEVGEILTTAHWEFSGCAHCCVGKPKCREQDWASPRRRRRRVRLGTAEE